jgi:hypothetical protein
MARERGSEGSQITIEELRRAILYVAEAVLQLTREADTAAAREAQNRLLSALDILVKLR